MLIHINAQTAVNLGLPTTGKAIELYQVELAGAEIAVSGRESELQEQLQSALAEQRRLTDEVIKLSGELESKAQAKRSGK